MPIEELRFSVGTRQLIM